MMFLENKYSRTYFAIVEKRKAMPASGNVEKHHIIPQSLGGNGKKGNIVSLTPREHFICHLLLPKMTTGDSKRKMVFAMRMLANMDKSAIGSKTYESIKIQYKALGGPHNMPHSEETKRRMSAIVKTPEWIANISASAKAGNTGRFIPSAETRKKMSDAQKIVQKGKTLSDAHKEKLSIIMKANPTPEFNFKGRKHSEETKQKMAAARRAYYAEKETT